MTSIASSRRRARRQLGRAREQLARPVLHRAEQPPVVVVVELAPDAPVLLGLLDPAALVRSRVPRDCHHTQSWQTSGAVSSVAPGDPGEAARHGARPISSTTTFTDSGSHVGHLPQVVADALLHLGADVRDATRPRRGGGGARGTSRPSSRVTRTPRRPGRWLSESRGRPSRRSRRRPHSGRGRRSRWRRLLHAAQSSSGRRGACASAAGSTARASRAPRARGPRRRPPSSAAARRRSPAARSRCRSSSSRPRRRAPPPASMIPRSETSAGQLGRRPLEGRVDGRDDLRARRARVARAHLARESILERRRQARSACRGRLTSVSSSLEAAADRDADLDLHRLGRSAGRSGACPRMRSWRTIASSIS